jgi:hypothetical protein
LICARACFRRRASRSAMVSVTSVFVAPVMPGSRLAARASGAKIQKSQNHHPGLSAASCTFWR